MCKCQVAREYLRQCRSRADVVVVEYACAVDDVAALIGHRAAKCNAGARDGRRLAVERQRAAAHRGVAAIGATCARQRQSACADFVESSGVRVRRRCRYCQRCRCRSAVADNRDGWRACIARADTRDLDAGNGAARHDCAGRCSRSSTARNRDDWLGYISRTARGNRDRARLHTVASEPEQRLRDGRRDSVCINDCASCIYDCASQTGHKGSAESGGCGDTECSTVEVEYARAVRRIAVLIRHLRGDDKTAAREIDDGRTSSRVRERQT